MCLCALCALRSFVFYAPSCLTCLTCLTYAPDLCILLRILRALFECLKIFLGWFVVYQELSTFQGLLKVLKIAVIMWLEKQPRIFLRWRNKLKPILSYCMVFFHFFHLSNHEVITSLVWKNEKSKKNVYFWC